jgi:hypothetical protein
VNTQIKGGEKMVNQVIKVNPESDKWIEDLKATLDELITRKHRLFISVNRRFNEIWITGNIFREENSLHLKFTGTEELTIRIEPPLLKRHVSLIVNAIAKYLSNGILETVKYVTESIINDPLAPTTEIEFLI